MRLLRGSVPTCDAEYAAATGDAAPGGSNSLTPAVVNDLPVETKEPIISSYSDALTHLPLDGPLAVIAVVVLSFIKEKPLATAIEHDVLPELIA